MVRASGTEPKLKTHLDVAESVFCADARETACSAALSQLSALREAVKEILATAT